MGENRDGVVALVPRNNDAEAGAFELTIRRPPEAVLEEARKAAVALKGVLEGKSHKVMFNGEQYLEFEDWQTIGRFYGLGAKVLSTTFVQYGAVQGFSSRAAVVRLSDGVEISAAESDCLNDEERWRARPKYEGRSDDRRIVGEEPVPLFQVKSMSQTRACAKALRQVLAWVVVLAGYKATPAEELPEAEAKSAGRGSTASTSSSGGKAETKAAGSGPTKVKGITEKTGRTGDRDWIRYTILFEDGREASTFDEKNKKHAEAAKDANAFVDPKIDNESKYKDLKGWGAVATIDGSAEKTGEPAVEPPVQGPEKIRSVRVTADGKKWIINTEHRSVVTDDESFAKSAMAARAEDTGLTPVYEVIPSSDGTKKVNKLTGWQEEIEILASTKDPKVAK